MSTSDSGSGSDMPAASTSDLAEWCRAKPADAANEIERLRSAMLATADQLHTLSMATEGQLRGHICTASNRLDKALGRQQSLHGEQF